MGFPTHVLPLDILHHAEHLIACDGAIVSLRLEGIDGACIIGDGDSFFDVLSPFVATETVLSHIPEDVLWEKFGSSIEITLSLRYQRQRMLINTVL